MALKLRVISDHYRQLGKTGSRIFGVHGGRIGRARDNEWVLPDPDRYLSGHHAKVVFRAGEWLLEDTSTNGVFINGADMPLSLSGTCKLKDGDRLRMGDYDILVSIDERSDFPPDASGQMPLPSSIHAVAAAPAAEDLGEALDITDLLGGSSDGQSSGMFELTNLLSEPTPRANSATSAAPISLLASSPDEGQQSTVVHGKNSKEWQMATRPLRRQPATQSSPARKEPADRNRRAPDGASELHAGVEAFCRGAGIDPAALPGDAQAVVLTQAGQMLREVVLGLMESLKNRADLKGRFHLSQTTIQPTDNNPLKFSASVDEAIRKLLDAHSSRYLGPVEALRDAFSDIKTHQVALSSATQAALDELMNRFDPSDLQERFDRGMKRGPLLGAANKMKYWDLYGDFFQVLNQRDEQGLPSVFSEEFTKAYADRVAGFQGKKK